ncbi:MAG: histidine phosphatase family protein [Candidatus Paceibacterota bacterium]|jgi:broad specificity phosphatase PhoE
MTHSKRKLVAVFQRHGATNKAQAGQHDLTRTLSEEGRKQAALIGSKIGYKIDLIISSAAGRAVETACITARAAGQLPDGVQHFAEDVLYPHEHTYPILDAAFKKIGYAPLASYLLDPNVVKETAAYAIRAMGRIWEIINEADSGLEDEKQPFVVLITSHAVCANILARNMQLGTDATLEDLVLVGSTSMDAGSAIVIELEDDKSSAKYITP